MIHTIHFFNIKEVKDELIILGDFNISHTKWDRQLDLIFARYQQFVLVEKCMTPLFNVDLYHPPLLLTV